MNSKLANFTVEYVQQIVDSSASYREILKKLGYNFTAGSNTTTLKQYIQDNHINVSLFLLNKETQKKQGKPRYNTKQEFINALNNDLVHGSSYKILLRLLKFGIKQAKCECCLKTTWFDRPIPLELHHVNCNHDDNRLSNLMVVCPTCHKYLHDLNKPVLAVNKSAHDVNNSTNQQIVYRCVICNKEISKGSTYCRHCAGVLRNKDISRKPTPYELIDTLRLYNGNFLAIGKKYGVSDNAVRKWCKSYGIPIKKVELLPYLKNRKKSNITFYK